MYVCCCGDRRAAPLETHRRDRDSSDTRRVDGDYFRDGGEAKRQSGAGRVQIWWSRLCSVIRCSRVVCSRSDLFFLSSPSTSLSFFPLITHHPPPAGPHSLQPFRHAAQRPLAPPPRPQPRPRPRLPPASRACTSSETPCPRPCSRRCQPPPPSPSRSPDRQWHSRFHRRS